MEYVIKIIDNQMIIANPDNPSVPISEFYRPCLFDGDICFIGLNGLSSINNTDHKLVSSPVRTSLLVGYFSTSQQVKFGKTKSGATIYQVTPFNPVLPDFLIPYKGKQTGKLVIVFKFKEWTKGLPLGEIVQVIGPMDFTSLVPTLQYKYGVNRKECKLKPNKNTNEESIIRKEINEIVFSIDPPGCVDIDDAMSWSENSLEYNIKIHIAQPTYWISETDMINRATVAFSTLYQEPLEPNGNLWGEEITKASSLLEGKIRPAYTMEFIFNKSSKQITNFIHYPSFITNTHAVDYENCLNISTIAQFYAITKIISGNSNMDTHELVSYWMVLVNNSLGKSSQVQELNIPYRVTKQTETPEKTTETVSNALTKVPDDPDAASAFANMQMESATYQINSVDNYHKGLGINNYIHFTSPIRRIVDSLIHWCLTYNINFNWLSSTYNLDINHINKLDANTKKFHHEINMLEKINRLGLQPNQTVELDGWVYLNTGNRWTLYFKELGFVRVKMWDFKFSYLMSELPKEKPGDKIRCQVSLKPGFLPKEKILIVPLLNLM